MKCSLRPFVGMLLLLGLVACGPSAAERYEQANQFFAKEDFAKAIPMYEELLVTESENPNLYPKLVISYARTGAVEKCADTVEKALEKKIDVFEIYNMGVLCYGQLHKTERRAVLYDEGMKKYPQENRFAEEAGIFFFQEGQLEKASQILAKWADRFPKEVDYNFNAAASFEKQKKYAEAETYYLRVLKQEPYHANANFGLSNIYEEQNKPELALKHLEAVVNHHPKHLSALYNLARLQDKQAPQKALGTWKKYLAAAQESKQPENFIKQAKSRIQALEGGR